MSSGSAMAERRGGRAADSPDDDAPTQPAAQPEGPRGGLGTLTRPSLELREDGYPADPADSLVVIGDTPRVVRPVRVRGRSLPPMPTDALRSWIVTGLLTLIGALTRFWQLGLRTDGGTPIFDEKYYAVQAAEMIRTGGVEDNQAFGVIVHPPLGKQIMAIPEMIFGYNPIGWRFASAICGTLCILLIVRSVRRMTRSTLLGGIAGVLLICDGVSEVMSRTALLDTIQTPFVLGAFACLILDRDQVRERLAVAVEDGSMRAFGGRVPLGARWWRFGCGFLLGCATAVKWNGAYWLVGFAILSVIWDICARHHYGVRNPMAAMFRRDFVPSLWSLAAIPLLTYIASYWAWFRNDTGWDRHVDDYGNGVIGALKSLVTMTLAMLQTTASIVTPKNPADWQPWESKPFAWPLSIRPVLYYVGGGQGTTGCGAGQDDCVGRILLVGTPALWWVSLGVAGWALWKAIGRLDWRYAAVLVGYSSGYLPWFTIFNRQMYFFYMTPVAPFLIIGITLVLGDILGRTPRRALAPPGARGTRVRGPDPAAADRAIDDDAAAGEAGPGPATTGAAIGDDVDGDPAPTRGTRTPGGSAGRGPAHIRTAGGAVRVATARIGTRVGAHAIGSVMGTERRLTSVAIVSIYVGLVVANFIWMWPILVGDPITPERLILETWLPSWG